MRLCYQRLQEIDLVFIFPPIERFNSRAKILGQVRCWLQRLYTSGIGQQEKRKTHSLSGHL
jgi:hypothetical protein